MVKAVTKYRKTRGVWAGGLGIKYKPKPKWTVTFKKSYKKKRKGRRKWKRKDVKKRETTVMSMERIMEGVSQHATLELLKFHIKLAKAKPRSEKSAGKWSFTHQVSGGFTGLVTSTPANNVMAGFQLHQELPGMMMGNMQLNAPASTPVAGDPTYKWDNNPFELNPYRKTTGSSILNAGSYASDYIHLKNIETDFTLKNASLVPCEILLHFFISKNNTNDGISTQWISSVAATTMGQATSAAGTTSLFAITPGAEVVRNGGANGLTYAENVIISGNSTHGTNPDNFAQFRKFWKLLHKGRHVLQPGEVKRFEGEIEVHRTLSQAYLNSSNVAYLKGFTIVPFLIVRGVPELIKPGGTGTGVVTTVTPEIIFTQNAKYYFETCAAKEGRYEIQRVLPGLPVDVAPATDTMKDVNDTDMVTNNTMQVSVSL